jgi:hypothetical protein
MPLDPRASVFGQRYVPERNAVIKRWNGRERTIQILIHIPPVPLDQKLLPGKPLGCRPGDRPTVGG